MFKSLTFPYLAFAWVTRLWRKTYGGAVRTGAAGGYAAIEIEIIEENDILKGLGPEDESMGFPCR